MLNSNKNINFFTKLKFEKNRFESCLHIAQRCLKLLAEHKSNFILQFIWETKTKTFEGVFFQTSFILQQIFRWQFSAINKVKWASNLRGPTNPIQFPSSEKRNEDIVFPSFIYHKLIKGIKNFSFKLVLW